MCTKNEKKQTNIDYAADSRHDQVIRVGASVINAKTTNAEKNGDPEIARLDMYDFLERNVLEIAESMGGLKEKLRRIEVYKLESIEQVENTNKFCANELTRELAEHINNTLGLSMVGNEIHIDGELLSWENMVAINKFATSVKELFEGIFEILGQGVKTDKDMFSTLNTRIDTVNKRIDAII